MDVDGNASTTTDSHAAQQQQQQPQQPQEPAVKRPRVDMLSDVPVPFDLVLMDVQMPGWSGLETTQHIRAFERDHQLPPVPIIGVSGAVDARDQAAGRESGMSGFVIKPIDVRILRSILSDVVRGQRSSVGNDRMGWF
ncbi:CheY-like superfamily [Entophlyctis helioformis]|nr:CheY-like superfamily [Entophlyctis helioformis]